MSKKQTSEQETPRRDFVRRAVGFGGLAATASVAQAQQPRSAMSPVSLPSGLGQMFVPRSARSRRASSWNPTGKNADRIVLAPGQTAVLADIRGAGCIRHIWVTIAHEEEDYLRKQVFRAYWDGESNPSIECPVGDFFGVGHARASNYSSMPLNMVSGGETQQQGRAAMNCFFPMPFSRGARFTIENQGGKECRAFYYYIDYEEWPAIEDDFLRFHAHWRREMPTKGTADLTDRSNTFAKTNEVVNLDGKENYVMLEATGRGHYAGCVLSIDHINPIPGFGWFGEGDDMIYIDGETSPSLIGTGTEDYFCAAWGYPGGFNPMPYHGISYATQSEGLQYPGKWTMYRFHIEDPIIFTKSIRVTIEHGHGNVQSNDYSSVAYWYQTEPHAAFAPLPEVSRRLPLSDAESLRKYWETF